LSIPLSFGDQRQDGFIDIPEDTMPKPVFQHVITALHYRHQRLSGRALQGERYFSV
jgi:hypothetical protein